MGQRRLRLDWRLTDLEHRTLQVIVETVQEEFARLGLGHIVPESWVAAPNADWQSRLVDCFHHAGTTRIGKDRRNGAVDANCAVFDVPNMFICGGSVFPTSGYANPTLTIEALAMRLTDHLKCKFKPV